MKLIYLLLIFSLLFYSCSRDSNTCINNSKPIRYEFIKIDSLHKPLLDSALSYLQSHEFKKDTSFNIVYKNDTIETEFLNVKEFGLFCNIILNDTATFWRTAYSFRIDKNYKWTYIYSTEVGHYLKISAKDINFDLKNEIVFSTIFSCSRIAINYVFISETKDYEVITDIGSTDSIGINYKTNEIVTFTDGGNFGTHEKIINKWKGKSLVPMEKYTRTYTQVNQPASAETVQALKAEDIDIKIGDPFPCPKYLYQKFVLKNDSLTLMKSQILDINENSTPFDFVF